MPLRFFANGKILSSDVRRLPHPHRTVGVGRLRGSDDIDKTIADKIAAQLDGMST
jgi:hypothetical protein